VARDDAERRARDERHHEKRPMPVTQAIRRGARRRTLHLPRIPWRLGMARTRFFEPRIELDERALALKKSETSRRWPMSSAPAVSHRRSVWPITSVTDGRRWRPTSGSVADRIAVADHVTTIVTVSRMSGKIRTSRSTRTRTEAKPSRSSYRSNDFENSSPTATHVSSRDADRHGAVVTSGGLGLAPLALRRPCGARRLGASSASFAFLASSWHRPSRRTLQPSS